MTQRRDLTESQFHHLRACSAQGMTKAAAAKEMGISHRWIDMSAKRLGRLSEIDELFPRQRKRFVLTERMMQRLRVMADSGLTKREACKRLGYTLVTINRGAQDAGKMDELRALFPSVNVNEALARKREREARGQNVKPLPRDTCPAVHWLTKSWRVAA